MNDLLTELPALPHDEKDLMFQEPWQAQAFAITLQLHEAGHFSWTEWAHYLSVHIKTDQNLDQTDQQTAYYRCWLAALEHISKDKRLVLDDELSLRRTALSQG